MKGFLRVLLAAAFSGAVGCTTDSGAVPEKGEVFVQGCKYPERTPEGLHPRRFREDVLKMPMSELGLNPKNATNTAGMALTFATPAKRFEAKFRILSINWMGARFGLYENGRFVKEFAFSRRDPREVGLEIVSKDSGCSTFEIVLPSYADVIFEGFDGAVPLKPVPAEVRDKKVYVALGDSISHGMGQHGASHATWPFLLARELDCEGYNLAVGGARVSVPVARMLEDWDRIDLITILVGYNDLHASKKSPEQFAADYDKLLAALRVNHPESAVYCITPLFTKKPLEKKTGHTIDEFRSAMADVVERRRKTDPKLFLVRGEDLTSVADLREDSPQDPVHLGLKGAAHFAKEMAKEIRSKEK